MHTSLFSPAKCLDSAWLVFTEKGWLLLKLKLLFELEGKECALAKLLQHKHRIHH